MRSLITALAVALNLVWAGAAAADPMSAAIAASEALQSAVAAADARSIEPPRLSIPEQAPLIRAAFNIDVAPPPETSEMGTLLPVCASAVKAMSGYVNFGLARLNGEGLDDAVLQRRQIALVNANSVRFQDEVAFGFRFGLRCFGRLMPAMARFARALPASERTAVRRDGLDRARHGIVQVYMGALMMSTEKATRDANSDMVLTEAALQADAMAEAMKPADRRTIIDAIDAMPVRSTSETARTGIAAIRRSMSRTDCGELCSF